eukprot:27248_4
MVPIMPKSDSLPPGFIGADVCHLNLHKTFCIPHGGGGPGMGPIGVAKHLTPFLPTHPVVHTGTDKSIGPVSAAPFGSASILPITWVYLKLMGGAGLKKATEVALLNANYMRKKLSGHYDMLYSGPGGYCAHEFIMDIRTLKSSGIQAEDIAKRLQDYGFHAPTMSFPVPNTLMIEPTESEPKAELDRLVEALISIRQEIREVEEGKADPKNNVLVNAPHLRRCCQQLGPPLLAREGCLPTAVGQGPQVFWPSVGRIDNAYGDRNLICSCPPMDEYVRPPRDTVESPLKGANWIRDSPVESVIIVPVQLGSTFSLLCNCAWSSRNRLFVRGAPTQTKTHP